MALAKGSAYHGLTILACCGAGAYGEVYYCKDISGKFLAVKIVSKQLLGTHWQRELQGVINYRRITENAPELLQIFHVQETEDSFFYTMEPADSCSPEEYKPDTLEQRLQAGAIPEEELLPILKGIFAGIKTIHNAGFAHRDIKPDNILFVKGVPKIGDIGLLSSLSNTMTTIAGTIEFIPPEVRNSLEDQDRPSRQKGDLYALGKVLYCMVTGNEPQQFPTMPENISPSNRLRKLLWQLSLALCNREPLYRLHTIAGVEKELQRIEKILVQGESFKELLQYAFKHACLYSFYSIILFIKGCKKHWILTLLVLLAFGGGAWYLWPEDPYHVERVKNKLYSNQKYGISMIIPEEWEIASEETTKKIFEDLQKSKKKMTPQEEKQFKLTNQLLTFGAETIYCDFDKTFADNIMIQKVPVPGKSYADAPDDDLKISVKSVYRGEIGLKTEVYGIKRFKIDGVQCVQIDLSHTPEKNRILNCMLCFKDYSVAVCLTAKKETYSMQREKFESVLKTLKITKK